MTEPPESPTTCSGEYEKPPYEVGYRKPPKGSRFKPGQSGNPKGRKAGNKQRTTQQIFEEKFYRNIDVKKGGQVIKMTPEEVMVERMIKDAMEGDYRARQEVKEYMAAAEKRLAAANTEQSQMISKLLMEHLDMMMDFKKRGWTHPDGSLDWSKLPPEPEKPKPKIIY